MRLTLVKIGGGLLDAADRLGPVLDAFAALEGPRILVHGGGRVASEMAERLGVESPMINGRRITSKAMLDIALMVFGGLMNRQLVAGLQVRGLNALGLTGADLQIMRANKRPVKDIDYGMVGDMESVNAEQLGTLLTAGMYPVLAPLTYDGKGYFLNTNADTIAASVAVALAQMYEVDLIFAFERPGVLTDPQDDATVVPLLTRVQADAWQAEGVIAGGMIPKLHNAWQALEAGVTRVLIGQAADGKFQGTEVVA